MENSSVSKLNSHLNFFCKVWKIYMNNGDEGMRDNVWRDEWEMRKIKKKGFFHCSICNEIGSTVWSRKKSSKFSRIYSTVWKRRVALQHRFFQDVFSTHPLLKFHVHLAHFELLAHPLSPYSPKIWQCRINLSVDCSWKSKKNYETWQIYIFPTVWKAQLVVIACDVRPVHLLWRVYVRQKNWNFPEFSPFTILICAAHRKTKAARKKFKFSSDLIYDRAKKERDEKCRKQIPSADYVELCATREIIIFPSGGGKNWKFVCLIFTSFSQRRENLHDVKWKNIFFLTWNSMLCSARKVAA